MSARFLYVAIALGSLLIVANMVHLDDALGSAGRNGPFTRASLDPCFQAPSRPAGWPVWPTARAHAVRGGFNDPRGRSFHFGVDVATVMDNQRVFAMRAGTVVAERVGHFAIGVAGTQHRDIYWHVRAPRLRVGMRIRRGQLLGTAYAGWWHVHIAEWTPRCGYVDPRRPGGVFGDPRNTERPSIGPLEAYRLSGRVFQPFSTSVPPAPGLEGWRLPLYALSGVVDFRAEVVDVPRRPVSTFGPQMPLAPAAWRGYLAPARQPGYHLLRPRAFSGARLARIEAFFTRYAPGTWRQTCWYPGDPERCVQHLVWHLSGRHGVDTRRVRNGAYQYCVEALTVRGVRARRCTPVYIHNGSGPRTVARTSTPIVALAAQDARIAWRRPMRDGARWCTRVVRASLFSDARSVLSGCPGGGFALRRSNLAIGGNRVAWDSGVQRGVMRETAVRAAARPGGGRALARMFYDSGCRRGVRVSALAGSGTTLIWGVVRTAAPGGACDPAASAITGGGVRRLTASSGTARPLAVPGAPAPRLLAASRGLIAVVPATVAPGRPALRAAPAIQIRSRAGAVVQSVSLSGTPRAIALSRVSLVALVHRSGGTSLEWYRLADGDRRGSVPVREPVAAHVDVSSDGERVVYGRGASVRLLNTERHRLRTLWTGSAPVRGVAIAANHVTWYTNVGGRGRVLTRALRPAAW
jgi:hypothetical protein